MLKLPFGAHPCRFLALFIEMADDASLEVMEEKGNEDNEVPGNQQPLTSTPLMSTPVSSNSEGGLQTSRSGSVIMSTGSAISEEGRSSSPQYTKLPKPPPLIAMSTLTTTDFIPKAQATVKLKADVGSPGDELKRTSLISEGDSTGKSKVELAAGGPKISVTKVLESTSSLEPAKSEVVAKKSEVVAKKSEVVVKKSPGSSPAKLGGLGAGKPKAFLAMMSNASTPKKQTKKPAAAGGGGSGGRGQGSKSKSSPLSGSASKRPAAEVVPSRTSNRNIKRPRTYEEEMDEMRAAAKASAVKKAKTSSKVNINIYL